MHSIKKKPGIPILRFARVLRAAMLGKEYVHLPPLNYHLEVTNRCNIRCVTCARLYDPKFRNKDSLGEMSMDTFHAVEPWLPGALRVNTVGFGEPFIHPRFPEILDAAVSTSNYTTVITNGTLLEEEVVSRLVAKGLDILVLSMDGGTPEIFEKIRRGAKWTDVINGLEWLSKYKRQYRSGRPRITVEFVALKSNFSSLPILVEVISRFGVKRLHIEPLIRGGNDPYRAFYAEENLANLSLQEVRSIYERSQEAALARSVRLMGPFLKTGADTQWEAARIAAMEPVNLAPPEATSFTETPPPAEQREQPADPPPPEALKPELKAPPRRRGLPYCTEPWTTCFVAWNGEVFPCCAAQGPALGDLTKDDLPTIWNGAPYRALRRIIYSEKVPDLCHHCVSNQRTLTLSIWAQFFPTLLPHWWRNR